MAQGLLKRGKFWHLSYADADGKIIRLSSHTTDYKKAQEMLIDRKKAIKDGKDPEPIKRIPNYTFSQLAAKYSEWCERQRSYRSKKAFISQLVDVFGNIPLRNLNTFLIEQFQTERLKQGKKKVKVGENEWRYLPNKPATINRLIATLKHCIHKGYQWEMLSEETLKRVRQVKLLEESNSRLRYLSTEECQALVSKCDARLSPIVTTALNSGMRKGEILGLKWDNVDLTHGFILLDRTKNGERREIPINNTLREMLRGIFKMRRIDVPYVFYDNASGKPYGDVKRSFQTALKKAGIRDFHFHDLRHTFASHLVMAGIDLTTVKELLGHKTLTMTLRYAHLAPAHKVKAVDILDSTLNGKPTTQKVRNLAVNQ